MITEIILRAYTQEGLSLLGRVDGIILKHTKLKTILIDHTNISRYSFAHDTGDKLISLDRHVAEKLDIPYFQISRIFDTTGAVVGRKIGGIVEKSSPKIRIIDTDMVHGETINLACNIFGTERFSVPLVVQPHQDLIDMEDLMYNQSLLNCWSSSDYYSHPANCNYLLNDCFFWTRTSLPMDLYGPLCDLFNKPKAYRRD